MKVYIFLPLYALIAIIFQVSVLDLPFGGRLHIELSLILVILAAFRLRVLPGCFFSIWLGIFYDALVGQQPGLYSLLYMIIYGVSFLVYREIYLSRSTLLMMYVFVCSLIKGSLVVIYDSVTSLGLAVALGEMIQIYLFQALAHALISPYILHLFNRIGFSLAYAKQGYVEQ